MEEGLKSSPKEVLGLGRCQVEIVPFQTIEKGELHTCSVVPSLGMFPRYFYMVLREKLNVGIILLFPES